MILGEQDAFADDPSAMANPTLDAYLRRAAARQPQALALADPPNRETFTAGAARVLTYEQANQAVSAIAARLRGLGLPTDAVVAIQLPNTVESVLTCLGVMRAGMIPALLPLLWRQCDIVAALEPVGAKAIITCGRVGATDHADIAMQAAAALFGIRYVCAYGPGLPDDVIALDDVFLQHAARLDTIAVTRSGDARGHVAAITFDTDRGGTVAVARDHHALLAGAEILESGAPVTFAPVLLSGLPISSFAGLSLTLTRWLLVQGTLLLHHPFDADVFARQLRECPCTSVVAPGPLMARLVDAGMFSHDNAPGRAYGVWRSPEHVPKSARWPHAGVDLIDVLCFGEIGFVPQRRDFFGRPTPLTQTDGESPHASSSIVEVHLTAADTLGMRGGTVPYQAFPPSNRPADVVYDTDENGVVDTGYPCQQESGTQTLMLTGAPPGIVSVGGCRFRLADLDDLVHRADPQAVIVPSADVLLGQRLSGHGLDQAALRLALGEMGVHPLIGAAFRDAPAGAAKATG